MIKYPLAEIGNKYYDYFVLRYGSFLKNIRFEEYDVILLLFSLIRSGRPSIGLDLTISISFPTIRNS